MLWKFGITIEQKRAMIVGQGGRCAACGQDILRLPTREQHLDHDHRKKKGDPGFIRGVVCKGCNTAIGFAKEDPDRLVRIAHYLRRHSDF